MLETMATYGKVEEYKEDNEWVEYIERLTHYCEWDQR